MFTVAVVEDEQTCAQTLQAHLARYSQETGTAFTVQMFQNALAFLNDTRTSYDIVFMDIEMPHQNGMEAAAEMRRLNSESVLTVQIRDGLPVADDSGLGIKSIQYVTRKYNGTIAANTCRRKSALRLRFYFRIGKTRAKECLP